MPIYSRL